MNFEGIDKISPVPYYYQLEQLLREKIENGKLKPGDILPSEAELCSTFKVSRTVVRQALNKLTQDGLVYKEKGKGTFVAKPKLQEKFVQRTLEAVAASKYEADMLKVPRGSPVVYLESISYLGDGTPFEYFEAWHRGDRCKFAIELVPAEEMKKIVLPYRENSTFWSGMPSKQTVSFSDRRDK